MILALLIKGYSVVAALNFAVYLGAFLRDNSTSKADGQSWFVLGLASMLWPIVVPISYLERRTQAITEATVQQTQVTSEVSFNTMDLREYMLSYSFPDAIAVQPSESNS